MNQVNKTFDEVQEFVDRLKLDLMNWDEVKLRALIQAPIIETTLIQNKKFEITRWVQQLPGKEKLSVLAEARLSRFGGLWYNVTCAGFYREKNGNISDMKEEDLWENGY